jgi:hypothetical protein
MPIVINVDIDTAPLLASLEIMPAVLEAEIERALVTSTFIVEADVKALTPRKTGRLFSGWESSMRGTNVGVVANRVSYAGYVERGTAPHEIVAKGNALRFTVAGQTIFRKRVQHPGFAGRFMAKLGAEAAKPKILEEFKRAIKRAIEISLGR